MPWMLNTRVRVYLVRHAEAAPGEPDELRALTPSGRDAARSLGQRLASASPRPTAVLTSPLLRARETGEELARALGLDTQPEDRLAPGATAEDVRAVAARAGDVAALVLVGHQPDCGRIAAEVSGGPEPPFPAAGMVELDVD